LDSYFFLGHFKAYILKLEILKLEIYCIELKVNCL